jgi:hypothetical protein
MAIKKRIPQTEEERAAAIAAFGDGAVPQPEQVPPSVQASPSTPQAQPSAPRTARTAARRPAAEPTGDVPSTSLVRWADEELPRAIQRIAAAEDRSFHKTMLQLLRRGVDDYDAKR